jgi:tRNA pseudouridine55 synthase
LSEDFIPNEDRGDILLLDKPLGWTSFDVVKKLRSAGRFKKIGHAGTLDPLATGLLVCCTGRQTKTIDQIQGAEKEYVTTFVLGATTLSYDLETEVLPTLPMPVVPSHEQVEEALEQLKGAQEQIPPIFSAVMVNGKRAYTLARKGAEVELSSKKVHVYAFELISYQYPTLEARVVCSKGTYIRALARDLGTILKTGAYLSTLRRTRIGDLSVEDAWPVAKLADRLRSIRSQAPEPSVKPD